MTCVRSLLFAIGWWRGGTSVAVLLPKRIARIGGEQRSCWEPAVAAGQAAGAASQHSPTETGGLAPPVFAQVWALAEHSMSRIVFLGTGGARILVFKQLLASGGMWMELGDARFHIDPGPGALVQATKRKLDPTKLDAIILSHRHLDHANDINAMMEAMSQGGTRPRGKVFVPSDALEGDPVVLRYVRGYVKEIVTLQPGGRYEAGGITFRCPLRLRHGVEAYGFIFDAPEGAVGYISDTDYFPELADAFRVDHLIINVLRTEPTAPLQHMSVPQAQELIAAIKPKVAILTHFGMTVWRAKPWEIAERMSQETGVRVIAARDGMRYELEEGQGVSDRHIRPPAAPSD